MPDMDIRVYRINHSTTAQELEENDPECQGPKTNHHLSHNSILWGMRNLKMIISHKLQMELKLASTKHQEMSLCRVCARNLASP